MSSERAKAANAAAIIQGMGSVISKPDRLPVESLLLDVADVLATSLDLDTTVRRVAEVVRKVIDYEIFAILLLNEKTQELRFRFQVGYPPEFRRAQPHQSGRGRHRIGGCNRGKPILIDDVTDGPALHRGRSQRALGAGDAADHQEPRDRRHRH